MKQFYLFKQMNCIRLVNLKQFKLPLFLMMIALFLFQGNIANAQCTLLNESFDSTPPLSASNADGAWYPDRYRPAAFESDAGRLKISISAADGAQLRPAGYTSGFFNTQGRKFNQCGKCVTVAKADLYIPSDWETNMRRSDIWATALNSSDAIIAYAIIGFRNTTGLNPNLSYWDGLVGWIDLGPPSAYDSWYNFEMRLIGGNLEYLINGSVVGVVALPTAVYLGEVIMQAFNFNDNTLGASYDSGPNNSYDSFWDNLITSGPNGNTVKNVDSGILYCSIQGAIDDPLTANGHTLEVSSGTFSENVSVSKSLQLVGANSGVDPNTPGRVSETILSDGKITVPGSQTVLIDGFHIYQTNTITPVSLGGGASVTIQNNIIERFGDVAGSTVRGMEISNGTGVKNINNNLITGDDSGGLFGSHKSWNSGIFLNGPSSIINIDDNVFENCRTAINLDDMGPGISLSGNTFQNSGTFMAFGGTSPTSGSFTFGANEFKTPGSAMVNLANVTSTFRLDISAGTFEGSSFASLPLSTLFDIESTMYHRTRSGRLGLVYYVPNSQYVISLNNNIQTAIDYAAAGDNIYVSDGSYGQRLVIDKPLALKGESSTNVLLDGIGLGNGSGIRILNGVEDVLIHNIQIFNHSGAGPNSFAGIYAVGGNNNLTITKTAIYQNLGGSGIFIHGPVDNVLISENTVAGHTNVAGVARGIVIWNGLKSNITITHNLVFNNNCCGIELQDGTATGVNISNNYIDSNGDNGIGVVGLQGPGENIISNNTLLNNGRFGIEIKNPDGSGNESGPGSIVVEYNNVSNHPASITDTRDLAGIAVFRRGVLAGNVDIPTGVVVKNNTVSGYQQSSVSEGFGIVIEGTNHTVIDNNLFGNDVGIQVQSGHLPYPGDGDQSNLADNYFGRGNSQVTCNYSISNNTLSNSIDYREVLGPDPCAGQPDLDGPITSNVTLSDDVIKVNESLTLTANVDDSTTRGSDIASAEYSYDGGTTWNQMDAVDGDYDSVSEDVTATFAAPSIAGIYQVCVRGTDSEGNTGDESCVELVVFNPNGGSVKKGKGRIESPPGALLSDPAAIGRADFDFEAEYKKKDDELKGKAKFKFKDGDIDFKEDNLHWLVINEDEDYAILRGDGEIKHRPGIVQFMIWGGEYDSGDTFRIRIWEQDGANEILIYDNMNDQVIDKGKIEIKPPKQARPLEVNNIAKVEGINEISLWPNPSKNQFNIKLNNKDFINATIEIHDFYGKRYDKPIKITKDGILTFGENLPKGFYIIKVIIDNEVNYLRIIKK